MALNTRFQLTTTSGGAGYDVETVMLHENGHVVGLDHSTAAGSIMQATYGGVQPSLSPDDERGITYLYPETWAISTIQGTVTAMSGGAEIAGAKVSIANFPVSATTGSNGQYTLVGVPDIPTYQITASASGYQSFTMDLDPIVPLTTNVNFALATGSGGGGGGCKKKGPFACP